MKYLPIVSRFIGGSSDSQLVSTIQEKLNPQKWIPIIDYAKEASKTRHDVEQYQEKLHKTLEYIHCNKLHYSLALKLSSFLPYKPEDTIRSSINHALQSGCKYIYLDAETHNLFDTENKIYNDIIEEYNAKYKEITVYKTYQMYKKDSFDHLEKDISNHEYLGIKLVRGAYYHQEPSNILFQTKEETDHNYDKAVRHIITAIHSRNIRVLFATHNNLSVQKAMDMINPNSNKRFVAFAQLLGMNDELSTHTATQNYDTYKYVPYGNIQETLPYLLRRLYENYDIMKHVFPPRDR